METLNKIKEILSEIIGSDDIKTEYDLQNDMGLDSIQMVTLLVMIEEAFEIILDESDMNPFDLKSVADVLALVEKYETGDTYEEKDR